MNAIGKWYVLHGSRKDEFTLWYLSDLHWMAKACAEKRIRADINRIKDDPFALWIGGGDYAEFIGKGDKRWDADAVAEWVKVADLGKLGHVAYTQIKELLEPIKGKCLGLVEGNHERHYTQALEQQDRHGWVCCELGVPNLGYSAFMDLVFCRKGRVRAPSLSRERPGAGVHFETFRIACHHGAGYAQTKGGKINRLSKFMAKRNAQIYMMGHVHDQTGTRESTLDADETCTHITHVERLGVISGGYLKTYAQDVTTYGEQKMYDPTTLGAAWVRIKPDTRELWGRI